MRKSSVRRIFIFFLFFLPFQYALVGIIGSKSSEPWPAFVFPGFKSIYTYEDGFELSSTIFELQLENHESVSLNPQTFFPEIPTSQISGVMRTHFSSEEKINSLNSETKESLLKRAAAIVEGPVQSVHIVSQKNYFAKPMIQAIPDSTAEAERFELVNREEVQ